VGKKRVGRYPTAFRQMVLERMKDCANVSELARELGIDRMCLYHWERLAGEQRADGDGHIFGALATQAGKGFKAVASGEDSGSGFFQRCLAKSRGSTPERRRLWRDGIYEQVREVMPMQGGLSVERMCELARVSRAGFYRSLHQREPVEESMEVRSAIQRVALEHKRRYGYRRVTAELRRRGMPLNHKRVARVMREDNLLGYCSPDEFEQRANGDPGEAMGIASTVRFFSETSENASTEMAGEGTQRRPFPRPLLCSRNHQGASEEQSCDKE